MRMLAPLLVIVGAVVLVGTVVAALRTRRMPDEEPQPDTSDPWAAYTPREVEVVEREGNVRLWPVASGLAGLVLMMGGLVSAELRDDAEPTGRTPPVVAFELGDTPRPEAVASPEASASASPVASATPRPSSSASPRPSRSP